MPKRQRGRRMLPAIAGIGLGLTALRAIRQRRTEDLHGQVVLITGGSRGLGFLLAREFAAEGCRVVICARDEFELTRAKVDLEQQRAEVLALRCDIANREQVDELVAAAIERFGRIDVLVNNAGIIQVGPVMTMTVEDYERALGVMFWGVLSPTLAVLPGMRQRGSGRIVNITSIGGKVSVPHLLPYNTAKFAAVGLSEGLRAELARYGISVTTVVPGLMRTGSHLNALFKGNQAAEFNLFAPLASLPLISIDAERAARQIVTATKRGDAELIISLPAHVAVRFHGLFPGTTANLLGLVNRLLPDAEADRAGTVPGMAISARHPSKLRGAATVLGRSAARRFHQFPGPRDAENTSGYGS
ncbi:MAG TPA: SDR family NAD(P)-dependent oxidoreductase [Thermomicrobiales bacterium]|nr:SDR family NAD(P)-dependent oxidoreductase [Thermomicrobiales bacterium]